MIKRIFFKLKICWKILFSKNKRWVVINMSDDDFFKLLTDDEDFGAEIYHIGVQKYVLVKMFRTMNSFTDDIDMVLYKAEFEAEAELLMEEEKNKKNKK